MLACSLSSAVQAQAGQPSTAAARAAGSLRFGLASTVLGYESVVISAEAGPLGLAVTRTSSTFGVSQLAGLGPVVGYALSESLMLNGRLALSRNSVAFDGSEPIEQLKFALTPSLDYLFGVPNMDVVPFVGLALPLLIGHTPLDGLDLTEVSVGLGIDAGVHFFLSDGLSIEPGLLLAYRIGTGSADDRYTSQEIDVSVNGFYAMLTVGLSAWR